MNQVEQGHVAWHHRLYSKIRRLVEKWVVRGLTSSVKKRDSKRQLSSYIVVF